ncbi:GFA family protein [Mycoplana ramosa]|uniref:GFA family protein n=1 Tax=Mycoplana ramosa TaxID=40837 RepID=A0ABW3YZL5_MYCRA
MSIARIYTGGCQCGAVRYRAEGTLDDPHLCHCRMCQKAAGNYFLPLANAARETFRLTRGEPGWFQSSQHVRRGFCRDCGTPLFYDMPTEGYLNIVLGSLDDPQDVRPHSQSGVESRVPWFSQLSRLPERETDPDGPAGREHHIAVLESNRQHPDYDTDHWPPED